MYTISPVSNLVTLLTLCVIAVAAFVRARDGRPYGWDQFLGALLVIAGTGVSIWLAHLLNLEVGRPAAQRMAQSTVMLIWYIGWMTSSVGFIVFAWAYISEALEGAGKRARRALPASEAGPGALRGHGAGS